MGEMMIRVVAALFFSLFLTASAAAQSTCPTIVYGAVLTAGQWNQCFANKQDVLGYTAVNQAGDVMAGRLVTTASTAFKAGLSISPGVAPSSPVNGDIWTTSSGMYVRINGTTVGPLTATGSAVPSVAQGDILYGSGVATLATLTKSGTATRYLSNTGTSNNPAWAQVDLSNGVTGLMPIANIANGTQDTVLGYFGSTAISASGLPNCGGALTYSTSSHGFGCNGSGSIFAFGTPTAGQLASWTNSTTIQGITRAQPVVCDIISSSATTCNNGGSAANNGTYTTPTGALYLHIKMAGGGAGGGGSGSSGAGAGGTGGNTCWNTSGTACSSPVLAANGGTGGTGSTLTGNAGGVGGTASGCDLNITGKTGGPSTNVTATGGALGGYGGSNPFYGGGGSATFTATSGSGIANTGAGGAGAVNASGSAGGSGGGSGAACEKWIGSPAGSYTYAIGAQGSAGAAGTGGNTGGTGALGRITIEAFYN